MPNVKRKPWKTHSLNLNVVETQLSFSLLLSTNQKVGIVPIVVYMLYLPTIPGFKNQLMFQDVTG